uniref:NADH-ubiquinone oxidoreductase chain 2 n=1 Tax=Grimothea gregaria TaxID=306053 RepID=A0A342KBK7_9EUCA|nr:NADH dehydrogenase subunit 2 [Grimothea gregaria]AND82237.1 NADH dehydrogenase subunit 2 [Grimothea gregaria]
MYLSLFNMLFMSTLSAGTLLAVSSSSWFNAWAGLELNLLSFIPLIISNGTRYSSEAALKYFLIQALGSSLIIFSSSALLFSSNLFSIILAASLLLKLGAAPFHFWFPQIIEGMLWPQAAILMTIQKVAPIFLLSYLMDYHNIFIIMLISSIMSAVVGAVGGVNQMSLRKIMAFSSINHMAWMLMASLISEYLVFFYFVFYCLMSLSVIMIFFLQQSFHFNHLINQSNLNPSMKVITFMSLLSLGGLPPFTGFFPKWILIQEMVNFKLLYPLVILLISTLVTLYYYLRISISFMNMSAIKLKPSVLQKKSFFLNMPMFLMMNMMGLMIPVFFIFY